MKCLNNLQSKEERRKDTECRKYRNEKFVKKIIEISFSDYSIKIVLMVKFIVSHNKYLYFIRGTAVPHFIWITRHLTLPHFPPVKILLSEKNRFNTHKILINVITDTDTQRTMKRSNQRNANDDQH